MKHWAVMVNGMPGGMGIIVAETVLERGLTLVPYSLTGEGVSQQSVQVQGQEIVLITPQERDEKIAQILSEYSHVICVDYTHPSAVNSNAEFYVKYQLPFVMGTTGGDREALHHLVDEAAHPCVIAPNMSKQIVALQAMLEQAAQDFPGAFEGYQLTVRESHQKTKADTSGTAKAMVGLFQKLGLNFETSQIEMLRTEPEQLAFGVPSNALTGHAYHTYHLTSNDQTVNFEIQHNVIGRKVYAQGSVDAVIFLAQKLEAKEPNRRWSMIDILRSGGMH